MTNSETWQVEAQQTVDKMCATAKERNRTERWIRLLEIGWAFHGRAWWLSVCSIKAQGALIEVGRAVDVEGEQASLYVSFLWNLSTKISIWRFDRQLARERMEGVR